MNDISHWLAEAADLAVQGRYADAKARYHALLRSPLADDVRSRIENDLAVIAAVKGHAWSSRLHFSRAATSSNDNDVSDDNSSLLVSTFLGGNSPVKVAILSLLFNWPSTGGGTVHTKELADFLTRDGYEVRHIYAVNASFAVGQVTEPLGYASHPLEFSAAAWNAGSIRRRFQAAVREFDPDWVVITDSWNTKPLLAEAANGYPYFLRIAAQECLCPLNNVRMLFGPETDDASLSEIVQCDRNQLAEPEACRECVFHNARFSGGLHQAERRLAGFDDEHYSNRLKRAFAEAEGVLAVNPKIAALVEPHTPAVHVIPSGFDPQRFPAEYQPPPPAGSRATRILFAGLRGELMKGFYVLRAALAKLRGERQDFELWVTGESQEGDPEYLNAIGWQPQQKLTDAMCATDLLVFPTVAQEALGRSAVEAMGCGRPVVASRIGGLDWVVEQERTGLLFTPGDVGDLCRQLRRLLDDRNLREQLGRAGQRKFQHEFTWESILTRGYRPLFGSADKREWSQGTGAVA